VANSPPEKQTVQPQENFINAFIFLLFSLHFVSREIQRTHVAPEPSLNNSSAGLQRHDILTEPEGVYGVKPENLSLSVLKIMQ